MSIIIPLFFFSMQSWALCLPDSAILSKKNEEKLVHLIEDSAHKFSTIFSPILKNEYNLDLMINLDVLSNRINADIKKNNPELIISVWGGMIRHPKMEPKVMTLLLCHELGHMLGGEPYKSMNGWSSTEGQADYYSSTTCTKTFGFKPEEFLEAALALTAIYAEVTNQAPPFADQCDPTEVQRINFGYPNAQCRLDTLINGWNSQQRPRCWFIE